MRNRLVGKSLQRTLGIAVAAVSLMACAAQPSRPNPGATLYAPQLPYAQPYAPQQSYAQPYAPQQAYAQPQYPGSLVPAAQPVPVQYQAPAPQTALLTPDVSAEPMFAASSAPFINAASYILLDANTGATLVSQNADTRRAVASTQKILTALVVLDAGNLDKVVRVTAADVSVEPTRLGIKPGETYTRRKLLYAFLIKSANDVANLLARDNAGSASAFAAKMNAKARSLGARSSNFRNPHGLPVSGQYSTARDMARIAMAAYRNSIIRDAVRQKYHTFRYATGRTVTLENTNELLGRMPECNGMKTGYTNASGRCLISTASSHGRAVILVQLGTKTKYIWNDGAAMMSWGLRRARG